MNIDNNLVDCLNSNSNLTKNQKEMLYSFLIKIKNDIFDPYIDDFNFDNVLPLIRGLKVAEGTQTDIIKYDKSSNTFVLGKSPMNQEFNTYKSLLDLVCQRYDEEENIYSSGLTILVDGKYYGTKINNLLTDHLITVNTGLFNKEENESNKIESSDIMIDCFVKIFGAENLVRMYANANGKEMYISIMNCIGSSNAKSLLDNPNVERLNLSTQACLLAKQETLTPKM